MKTTQKVEARNLRQSGYSCKAIARQLGVALSSVSVWVRDIKLSVTQRAELLKAQRRGVSKSGELAAARAQQNRSAWDKEAHCLFKELWRNPLFSSGLGIYAGEGNKRGNTAAVTNSDSDIICAMIKFFHLLGIDNTQLRLRVNTYADLNSDLVCEYWHSRTGLDIHYLYMTTRSVSSKGVARKSRYGTAYLCVRKRSAEMQYKILLWLKLLYATVADMD